MRGIRIPTYQLNLVSDPDLKRIAEVVLLGQRVFSWLASLLVDNPEVRQRRRGVVDEASVLDLLLGSFGELWVPLLPKLSPVALIHVSNNSGTTHREHPLDDHSSSHGKIEGVCEEQPRDRHVAHKL